MIHDHPHPGEILRQDVLKPLRLSVADAAACLGMDDDGLCRLLSGEAGISPELATRLEQAGVSTARFWLKLQSNYELGQESGR